MREANLLLWKNGRVSGANSVLQTLNKLIFSNEHHNSLTTFIVQFITIWCLLRIMNEITLY